MNQQSFVPRGSDEIGPYHGKTVVLTTKHQKAKALALPLKAGLGLLIETVELDTDLLGTFTGEIERKGSPLETAVKKARLGMSSSGANLGIANEGSFGPHPLIPFIPFCQEIIVLVDDELGIQVSESVMSSDTNYGDADAQSIDDLADFLLRSKFPSHGLIVRSKKRELSLFEKVGRAITGTANSELIYKGIQDRDSLSAAILSCKQASKNGSAHVETDMRAHMNPTRMRCLRALAVKLARRLRTLCPDCRCPGFGITGTEGSLPCQECGYPSEVSALEVHSCPRCRFTKKLPRQDGIAFVEAMDCALCNP